MKTSWKDYIYIQKNDKNSIVILLFLLIICGGAAIGWKSYLKEKNALLQRQALAEFDKFQNEMIDIESSEPDEAHDSDDDVAPTFAPKNKPKEAQPTKLKTGQTLDINKTTLAGLKRIPGVGDSYAQRIVEYRDLLGGFSDIEQLKEIKGFTGKRFINIVPYLQIGQKPRQLSVNKCAKESLIKHPYLNENQADFIISRQNQNLKIASFDDLSGNQLFTPRDIDRLAPYFSFD